LALKEITAMTQQPVDPVPSIPEAEATGATKPISEDFKAVSGVPVVNLIFRHVATLPGGLEWSWDVLRPLYASDAVAMHATHLMDDLETPALPRLPHAALRAVGVDAAGESAINRILDAYNRSNPMNLEIRHQRIGHHPQPMPHPLGEPRGFVQVIDRGGTGHAPNRLVMGHQVFRDPIDHPSGSPLYSEECGRRRHTGLAPHCD
jgi:hypothetical protein